MNTKILKRNWNAFTTSLTKEKPYDELSHANDSISKKKSGKGVNNFRGKLKLNNRVS